jgi:hypothetical protein
MKKKILFVSLALSSILILPSCSMQKRLYRDGYSISWNHKKNQVGSNQDQKERGPAIAEENNLEEEQSQITAPVTNEEAVKEDQIVSNEKPAVVPEKKKGIISKIIKDDTPEEIARISHGSKSAAFKSGFKTGVKLLLVDEEAHTHHLAIASFVLGIISLFAYYGAFVLGLLAVIFGAIAIHKIRKSGGTYRGNTMAWLGLIFGIIAIVLTTVIIRVYV